MRVQNPPARMRGFLRENQISAFAVKLRSPFDKLLDVFRAFGDQRFDRFFVAESRARDQRIFLVKLGVIVVRKNDRDAALRVFGVRFAGFVFC